MSNNGRSISSAIEKRLWMVKEQYKKLQRLGWNSRKYWNTFFPHAKVHSASAPAGYPERMAWRSIEDERNALRYKTFVLNLYVAHSRGKIHCRKLTKTDICVPHLYRDTYSSDRFPEPGTPRPLAHPGREILTLEDQRELLVKMIEKAQRYPTLYGSAFEPGELDALLVLANYVP